ncbi:MAG: twin-arginine translocation signal domain-containing protein, partial [Eggerthellaceae bacterium]|nr:twin-arginine translocation signal domain-containing protein [Eggerthellaceae bacterium]
MTDNNGRLGALSRRSFLKTTGAVAGAAAVAGGGALSGLAINGA